MEDVGGVGRPKLNDHIGISGGSGISGVVGRCVVVLIVGIVRWLLVVCRSNPQAGSVGKVKAVLCSLGGAVVPWRRALFVLFLPPMNCFCIFCCNCCWPCDCCLCWNSFHCETLQ